DPPVAPVLAGDDPWAWHAMEPLGSRSSRRLRRLDLWRAGDQLMVDAMFRDTTTDPDLTARVVHEYRVAVALDPASLTIVSAQATPRSLPFPTDCPLAAASAADIVGVPAPELRARVRAF